MKIRTSRKYKSYGPIPQNEYTNTKLEDTAAVLEYNPQPGDTAYQQRLAKRQAMHPSGRKKLRDGSRFWKANGWRAESAALHDELTSMGRYSDDVRKSSRPL